MDNRVNLSALGERRVNPVAAASQHTIYLGGGESIGAAVVVDGRLYRGANGWRARSATSRCPRGPTRSAGAAMSAASTRSPAGRPWSATAGCSPRPVRARPWPRCSPRPAPSGRSTSPWPPTGATRPRKALLQRSARLLGNTLATLVSVFNPDLVILGGGMARASSHLIAAIREAIYRRALPSATQDLRIEPSAVDMEIAGVIGAVQFAVDQVFAPEHLPLWLDHRSPAGLPEVAGSGRLAATA